MRTGGRFADASPSPPLSFLSTTVITLRVYVAGPLPAPNVEAKRNPAAGAASSPGNLSDLLRQEVGTL